MPSLTDYVKGLESYTKQLDNYAKAPIQPLKIKKAAQVTAVLDALAITKITKHDIEALSIPVVPKELVFDFAKLEEQLRWEIDVANKAGSQELSSDNPSMLWNYAQREAMSTKVESLEEAAKWFDWLISIAKREFYYRWGAQPLDEKCHTCQPNRELYSGNAPTTVDECKTLWAVIRKLSGNYLAYKVSLMHLWWCIEDKAAILALIDKNYDFVNAGIAIHRAWNAGEIAKSLLKPVPTLPANFWGTEA